MAFTVKPRAAPFGSAVGTTREFSDGTQAASFAKTYHVWVESECDDGAAVLAAARAAGALEIVPGAEYEGDHRYVVSRVDFEHSAAKSKLFWVVTARHEPKPWLLSPEVHFQTSHYQEAVYKDELTRKMILNKAGEPFAEALMESKGHLRIEIVRSFAGTLNPEALAEIIYHQNSDAVIFTWRGRQYSYYPGTLYCTDLRCPWSWDPAPHFAVTAAFEVNLSGWTRHPINAGYRAKNPANSTGDLIQCKEAHGVRHGGLGLLDNDGFQLPAGSEPLFLDVETIPAIDFNLAGIFP